VAEEIRVRTHRAAANASAQLIELREAEGIGAVHDEGVGVRNVESRFNDGGRKQNIDLT